MRIKSIECEQFAGLQDKKIELSNGMNIIVGDNECGKSTMIDLIYNILFKDVKLDGRKDATFIDRYFPKKISGPQGDVIDGVIYFETENGTYKLKKEWEKGEGNCRLTTPDGTIIKSITEINKVLDDLLEYKAGVYNEIVLASQKRNQFSVESIMRTLGKKSDDLSDTREALLSTLKQATLETGGVSIEKLERSLNEHLETLGGRWDFKADAPEGGPKRASFLNKWDKGAGEIVKAYYEMDELRSKQKNAANEEIIIENETKEIQKIEEMQKNLENKREFFSKYIGKIESLSLLTKRKKEIDNNREEYSKVLEKWPESIEKYEQANILKDRLEMAEIHETYKKAEKVNIDLSEKNNQLVNMKEVDSNDLKSLNELSLKKQIEENKLTGMNLAAKLSMLGDYNVSITSIASGESVDISDGFIDITEAVNIHIADVMDLQLMPKGIDVDMIKKCINEIQQKIETIYKKYNVKSYDELQKLQSEYIELNKDIEKLKLDFERTLGNRKWEDICEKETDIPSDIEPVDVIKNKISEICGSSTIEKFIGGLEANIKEYESKHISIDELKKKLEDVYSEAEDNRKKINELGCIPEEYQNISDPDSYDKNLKEKIENCETNKKQHDEALRSAEIKLGEKSAEEYAEELSMKEELLDSKKSEYEHWNNINDVFMRIKQNSVGNPAKDIEEKFSEYLALLSEDNIKLKSMDEKMSVDLASGLNALTYDILSEGTKDTVSLAFRLAMLEHLYPEGNGIAVFDDPFTDMDPGRVSKGCKLLQKFAENNQVLFITCDNKYTEFLSGTNIVVNK